MRRVHRLVNHAYYDIAAACGVVFPNLLYMNVGRRGAGVHVVPLAAEVGVVEPALDNLPYGIGLNYARDCGKFVHGFGNGNIGLVFNGVEPVKAFPAGTLLVFAGIGENPFHSLDSELIDSRIESH